ncbi:hypothetical protein BDR04DRAFT_1107965 [Suillus decipiens]|nr:hypothetical protein BDR04DRAFT_1107965 [Suillus decipiens]
MQYPGAAEVALLVELQKAVYHQWFRYQLKYNIDAVDEFIIKCIPIPVRDFASVPHFTLVLRAVDILLRTIALT